MSGGHGRSRVRAGRSRRACRRSVAPSRNSRRAASGDPVADTGAGAVRAGTSSRGSAGRVAGRPRAATPHGADRSSSVGLVQCRADRSRLPAAPMPAVGPSPIADAQHNPRRNLFRPLADGVIIARRPTQPHIEAAPGRVVDVADEPVAAFAAAVGEIVAADRLGVLGQAARQVGQCCPA